MLKMRRILEGAMDQYLPTVLVLNDSKTTVYRINRETILKILRSYGIPEEKVILIYVIMHKYLH